MKTASEQIDTITLESPDGKFFRRINPDGSMEKKYLGMDWQPHDEPTIARERVAGYVATMTKQLRWKVRYSL